MLRSSELRLLQQLQRECSLSEIADTLDRSVSFTSEIVTGLEEKGLVHTYRDGREKRVRPIGANAVELFQRISRTHSHVDFPDLLAGKAIPVLYYLDEPRAATELAELTENHRKTVYRTVQPFIDRGIIGKQDSRYRLNSEFDVLFDLARAFVHHQHLQTAMEYTSTGTILWDSLHEFLLQTPDSVTASAVHETGPARFQDYGIPLLSTSENYYFYSERLDRVTPEELVCHTLLIDDGTRHLTYCLLLIRKQKLDRSDLVQTSERYGVTPSVETLFDYLETQGQMREQHLPRWEEFLSTASDYGVEA